VICPHHQHVIAGSAESTRVTSKPEPTFLAPGWLFTVSTISLGTIRLKRSGVASCSTCGSSLFFDPIHRDWIGISMGAFDGPTHTKLEKHIFVASKGDYYEIGDGLPQNPQ
jgi:hypothetical protein